MHNEESLMNMEKAVSKLLKQHRRTNIKAIKV
jgi:hypothetical protein